MPLSSSLFTQILTQCHDQQSLPKHLVFPEMLTDEQLCALKTHIIDNTDRLAYSRVSLHVTKDMLAKTHYLAVFDALNNTALQKLDLVFTVDELNESASEIAIILNKYVSDRVNYPVIICEESSAIQPYKGEEFNSFNTKVVERVQQHNQAILFGTATHQPLLIDEQTIEQYHVVSANAFDKKIKLKELIKYSSTRLQNIDQYIKLEVQHTEVEQQEQVQEEIVEIAVQEQQQEQGLFDGRLVDFAMFQNEPYRSRVGSDHLLNAFRYELFGNMPHAIKYLSHEAAMKMAENAAAFVALNADNLPQNFMLKRTPQGEMVLDYDEDADEQKTNAFTPKEIPHYAAAECLYDHVDLPESIKTLAAKYSIDTSSKQLDNLWVRYGDAGVQLLLNALGEPGELSAFMMKYYLNRFPHWDRLLDDRRFLDSLEKIKQYEQAELTCLTEFLSLSDDTTQFNLEDILKGFDAFWFEWSLLANKNKLDLNEINGRWSHKKVGNPLVYMERLLTILRNSRDLTEQLACLDGLDLVLRSVPVNITLPDLERDLGEDKQSALIQKGNSFYLYGNKADGTGWGLTQLDAKIVAAEKLPFPVLRERHWYWDRYEQPFDSNHTKIYQHIAATGARTTSSHSLDNYGAYYASKYEGFHIVSKEMGLHYDPDKQNAVTFNPDSSVYRAELDRLIEYCAAKEESKYIDEPLLSDEILREEITYKQIIEKAYRFIGQQPKGIPLPVYAKGLKQFLRNFSDKSNSILTSLFFVAHERYKGDVEVYTLLKAIERMECHSEVVIENNRSLMKLFQQDTRLSDQEGYAISERVGMLNSAETDRLDKTHYIQKLFVHLQNNKHGMLKAIQHFAKNPGSKWPFVYALDTAEYFMKNTRIATHYHAELLLFSTLINSEYKEVYFERRNDKDADKIKQNLELVTEFLLKAATGTHPNNLDYAIKGLYRNSRGMLTKRTCPKDLQFELKRK